MKWLQNIFVRRAHELDSAEGAGFTMWDRQIERNRSADDWFEEISDLVDGGLAQLGSS